MTRAPEPSDGCLPGGACPICNAPEDEEETVVCPYCGNEAEAEEVTCGSLDCRAWLAEEMRADGEDAPEDAGEAPAAPSENERKERHE